MIVICKECHAEISGWAITCPTCGCPHNEPEEVTVILKNPIATGMLLGWGFLICFFILAAAAFLVAIIVV